MRRRSRASSKSAKAQRRKAMRTNAPIAKPRGDASVADLQARLERQAHELIEARELQAATAEVLRVISILPHDIQPVFDAIAENAARICQGQFAFVGRFDDELLRFGASHGLTAEGLEAFRRVFPRPAGEDTAAGRAILRRAVVQIPDVLGDPAYGVLGLVQAVNYRSILAVPMLRDGDPIGAIAVPRAQVGSFSANQIELLQTFARQAVIAIENVRLFEAEQERTRELSESLEQQTATSEVLQVISSSTGKLDPVFDVMLANATRICEARFGTLYLRDGDSFRAVAATRDAPPAYVEARKRRRLQPAPDGPLGRAAITKQVVQITDIRELQSYHDGHPFVVEGVELGKFLTALGVPMLKDDELIGVITILRQEVRPFTDKQIELVKNFAAQAVIAIENTRLLSELRESLQQQTATADVLRTISSSPGELEPVFQAMLENATRLCEATFGTLYLQEGDGLRVVALHGAPLAYAEERQRHPVIHPGRTTLLGQAVATKRTGQIANIQDEADYAVASGSTGAQLAKLGGARTVVAVPMVREDESVGAIVIYRQEVRPFSDKQVELLTNFAAQAVIAIENTRLLNELRQSLEQQTATADVLRVISSSPGELEPVFQAMLENAVHICQASFGNLLLYEGDAFRHVALHNAPEAWAAEQQRDPIAPRRSARFLYRVAETKQIVHIADIAAENPDEPIARVAGARTLLIVPMLKENDLIGVIAIYRQEVRLFADKQIELVKSFAAQAVIAIENTRLLSELRTRTDELGRSVNELRALGEVSQAVNSTLDIETVLSTIVAKAVQLSGTEAGAIYGHDEQAHEFRLRATYGMDEALIDALMQRHFGLDDPNVREALAQPEPIQVADLKDEAPSDLNEITLRAGFRARLVATLQAGEDIVGMLVVRRKAPGSFPQNTIDLIKTFAAQSALAIQNARLFHEIEDKSRELAEASQHKSQFLANMSHELRTPLNAILGYTELMADGAYGEPSEKMLGILKRLESNGKHLLGLINDVLDLSKIEAGQLVLELSDYCIQDIAQTVRSTLEPLAADKKLAFKVDVASQLPPGRGDGRRLTQVLINLVGNAIKFTDAGEVAIKAEAHNGSFHVSVRDTGPGISSADQARLFQEFQQADNAITKKKGGTGLGLAISKRIIEMHGGRIWVESQPGQGSTFAFTLPVIVERQVEAA
jgi:signal transduction histidine kinase/putative methionine-R-sulfoxide reductase with GAF domain